MTTNDHIIHRPSFTFGRLSFVFRPAIAAHI